MSVFWCDYCESYKDCDVDGCEEHPVNENEMCYSCYEDLLDMADCYRENYEG